MFLLIPLDLPNIIANKIMDVTLLPLDNIISSSKVEIGLSVDRINQITASRIDHKDMMLVHLVMPELAIRAEGSGTGRGEITTEVEMITMTVVGIKIIRIMIGTEEGEVVTLIGREVMVIMEETGKELESIIAITLRISKILDRITTLSKLTTARSLTTREATFALGVQVPSTKVPIEKYDDKILLLALLYLSQLSILDCEPHCQKENQILRLTNLVDLYDLRKRMKRKQKWRWRNQSLLLRHLRNLILLLLISFLDHLINLL